MKQDNSIFCGLKPAHSKMQWMNSQIGFAFFVCKASRRQKASFLFYINSLVSGGMNMSTLYLILLASDWFKVAFRALTKTFKFVKLSSTLSCLRFKCKLILLNLLLMAIALQNIEGISPKYTRNKVYIIHTCAHEYKHAQNRIIKE